MGKSMVSGEDFAHPTVKSPGVPVRSPDLPSVSGRRQAELALAEVQWSSREEIRWDPVFWEMLEKTSQFWWIFIEHRWVHRPRLGFRDFHKSRRWGLDAFSDAGESSTVICHICACHAVDYGRLNPPFPGWHPSVDMWYRWYPQNFSVKPRPWKLPYFEMGL